MISNIFIEYDELTEAKEQLTFRVLNSTNTEETAAALSKVLSVISGKQIVIKAEMLPIEIKGTAKERDDFSAMMDSTLENVRFDSMFYFDIDVPGDDGIVGSSGKTVSELYFELKDISPSIVWTLNCLLPVYAKFSTFIIAPDIDKEIILYEIDDSIFCANVGLLSSYLVTANHNDHHVSFMVDSNDTIVPILELMGIQNAGRTIYHSGETVRKMFPLASSVSSGFPYDCMSGDSILVVGNNP